MGMMSMLVGAGGAANPITLIDQTVSHVTGGGSAANAEYRLGSDGVAYTRIGMGAYTPVGNWCDPAVLAGDFEVLATNTVGSLSTGTTGTWLALTTTRTWTVSANIGALKSCTMTIDVRRVGASTASDTATITLEADALL